MGTSIKTIKGMTPELAAKLKERSIDNTDELLAAGRTGAQRRELAKFGGVTEAVIRELVQRADLARLKGVGDAFADLLEAAGVDSTQELGHRRADNLHAKLVEVNTAKNLVSRVPDLDDVTAWIAEAKTLEDLIDP
jgi:predicted flap endonuclease-1-like 5' DNA nuclease